MLLNIAAILRSVIASLMHRTIFEIKQPFIFFKTPYMPHRTLILLFFAMAMATTSQAQNYKTAIGLRLSSHDATVNNSISIKEFINRVVALEALFSVKPAAVGVLAEVHQPVSSQPGFRWLFGGGAYVGLKDGITLGGQGILGLDYKFTGVPLNITADWKPELNFTNEIRFEPAAVGLSARFTLR